MKKRALWPLVLFFVGVSAAGCGESAPSGDWRASSEDPEHLHATVNQLTNAMMHDIFSPPQAGRAYAYPSVAAYEALVPGSREHRSLAGQLNGLTPPPVPDTSETLSLPLASLHAFLTVAEEMVYTVATLNGFHEKRLARYRAAGMPNAVYERSLAHGQRVARHVLDWASGDNYAQLRSAPGYAITSEPGRWTPTPPAYMNGIGANWHMLRPFVLDSAAQFKPPRPLPYDMAEGSPFYEQVREVYETSKKLTDEEREIAGFWNCNPFAVHKRGHATYATKQITPGGHWMRIGAVAARQTGADFARTAETYARVALAVADGFISAFDEKYRSKLVRPETVIKEHFEPGWQPTLQTPPFPEYTSAHSVISASAAVTLEDLYGAPFAFRDTTEVAYGLPVRSFDSFWAAAEEATISRIYGGIHYPMAAQNGIEQGEGVGRFVNQHLVTRMPRSLATTNSGFGLRGGTRVHP